MTHDERLPDEDLEAAADELLEAAGCSAEYPHLSRWRDAHAADAWMDEDGVAAYAAGLIAAVATTDAETVDPLERNALLLRRAGVRDALPRRVGFLRLCGATGDEIARALDLPVSRVWTVWRRVRRRLTRLWEAEGREPGFSLQPWFRCLVEDQSRGVRPALSHCPDGREACRKTGVCHNLWRSHGRYGRCA